MEKQPNILNLNILYVGKSVINYAVIQVWEGVTISGFIIPYLYAINHIFSTCFEQFIHLQYSR